MEHDTFNSPNTNTISAEHPHLICWKSIVAGVLISIMSFIGLAAVGAGAIGTAAQNAIEQERNGSLLATGAGIGLGLAVVVSLFLGSYFAVRVSKTLTSKVGAAHGFIVASLFFIVLLFEAGSTLGYLSHGIGRIAEGIGQAGADVSSSPVVQDSIYQTLGAVSLKADPKEVTRGLAQRLLLGNVESAKSYYAYQTGLSKSEVDAQIEQMRANFDYAVKISGEKAAVAFADAGYSLAVVFLVGLIAALFGGRTGAHANIERPLAFRGNRKAANFTGPKPSFTPILNNERGSLLPYVFGWLLGVPMSLLFLIFLLRSVF